jgi:hypothetical protein
VWHAAADYWQCLGNVAAWIGLRYSLGVGWHFFLNQENVMKSSFSRWLAICTLLAMPVVAQEPALFRGADLKLGEKLIAESKCVACHQQKVGGDGSAIYKPAGKINTPAFLRGVVEQCNTELNLGLFPEEVTAVAAILNRDHYRFR